MHDEVFSTVEFQVDSRTILRLKTVALQGERGRVPYARG